MKTHIAQPSDSMKTIFKTFIILLLALPCVTVHAQKGKLGAGSPMPDILNGAIGKLFGENKAFVANMEVEVKQATAAEPLSMPTSIHFLNGNSRIEMDLSRAKGPQIPPGMGEQIKAMGMAELTLISRDDKQLAYLVYPGLQSYAEIKADATNDASKTKLAKTEVGRETIDGHPCIKNKQSLTDANGKKTDALVWNATDLKEFPLRIETLGGADKSTLKFTNVKFEKPVATLFDPPAGFTKYDDAEVMVQEGVMKKLTGGAGGKPVK
jgi:hypothetical protein